MSCEARHRELVATLLALAGVTTPTVDEVIGVGIGRRYTRRGRQDNDDSRPVQLDADIRRVLQIRGHADDSLPAWVGPLLDALLQARGKGNRRAFLTFLLLTKGWDAVLPNLTTRDIPWIEFVRFMKLSPPSGWDDHLRVRPTTVVSQTLGPWERQYISVADMLDAITGLDTVPPESARTVTPLQVMQVFWHWPMMPRLDLQRVLRAILEDAPGVSTLITQLREAALYDDRWANMPPYILRGRAAGGGNPSLARLATDTLLGYAQHWIHAVTGVTITPDVVCNPPPDILNKIVRHNHRAWSHERHTNLALPILFHCWRTHERHDVCVQVSRRLVDAFMRKKTIGRNVCAAMVAGTIMPPYGDRLLLRMDDDFSRGSNDVWNALAAIATYIAVCQATGHLPVINDLTGRLQHAWGHHWYQVLGPTITPILAVGRERDLLLPALMAARSTERWVPMILDCIDAASILDAVGSDPSGFLAVLNDALTAGSDPVDPRIIVRLAASPWGQRLLSSLFNGTDIPPWAVMGASSASHAADTALINYRIAPHLVSPYWDTAPDPLRVWWQDALTQTPDWTLDRALPLYPAVMPQVVIAYPQQTLLPHALTHPQWDTIPEATRRAVLDEACRYSDGRAMIDLILRATTDAGRQDVLAVAAKKTHLSDAIMRVLRLLAIPTG